MYYYSSDLGLCTFAACFLLVCSALVAVLVSTVSGIVWVVRGPNPDLIYHLKAIACMTPFWFMAACSAGFGLWLLFKEKWWGELFGLLALFIGFVGAVFTMALLA